ncbi:AraC family transcriptional regulator [Paenibacillus aceris]|uniref:AraC-like DNA-binding protein n=1 Tax=Paenibacillus aceris TaxID=869555 RepID=A0ABS4I6K0_9BACL|nr:AraC family transcriptional regulator [Paenibacillus aceris]MBP1966543.1 AraC-like DNA-binding protein [Paenibacillus aceris]NHW39485.1 AraC family transcriptional regulator [Paenibacillus aceris]
MSNLLERYWKRFFQRKTFFRNMVTLALFATIVPVLAVGFGSYLFSSSAMQKEVNQSNVRILNNVSSTIDSTLDRIQNNAIQMMLGSFFSSNLTELKSTNYSGFYSSISRELSALQSGNKEVSDVAMYVPDEGYLISSIYGGRRIESDQQQEALRKELESEDQIKWVTGPYPNLPGYNVSGVTLISKVPLLAKKPAGLLFIHIDEALFKDIMDRFVSYNGEQMYILNAQGDLVTSTGGELVPRGLLDIVAQKREQPRFTFEVNGTSYMVTPITSDYNKWQYINLVPVKELSAKSNGIALITLVIVAICLVLGSLFAFWGTRRVYRPIQNLVTQVKGGQVVDADADEVGFMHRRWMELSSEANELQQQLSDQVPMIREIFALQLLQGRFLHYSEEQLDVMLRRYDVPAVLENCIFVIAYDLQQDRPARFQESDRDLIVFAVKNIVDDLLRSHSRKGIIINLLNDQVAVWLFYEQEQEEAGSSDVKSFIDRLRGLVSDYLHLPVTIGMSGQSDLISDVPELYEEAVLAVRSRILVGDNQVITHTGGSDSELHYRYPIEIETHFENSLQIGDKDEAERMLDEFAKSMQEAIHKPELIQISYYRLLTAAIRTAYLFGVDSAKLLDEAEADPYTQIRKISTIRELNEWFKEELVSPITAYVLGKQHQEHEQLIHKVVRFIEDNYHFDLSLDQCAQICGLSPHYLSKLFKKTMDVSFIEFLTKLRIESSIDLLRTTDLSVSDVAEKVGYQTKNFIRVFKKHTGVTPGQFRGTDSAN